MSSATAAPPERYAPTRKMPGPNRPPPRPTPGFPTTRRRTGDIEDPPPHRRSSDDIARVIAEEAAAEREAKLLVENADLHRSVDQLTARVLELEGKVDRVEKTSRPPADLSSWHRILTSIPAILIALTGLITSLIATSKASSTAERVDKAVENTPTTAQVRAPIEKLSENDAQFAHDLAELRKYHERLARERAAEPAGKARSKPASSAGPDLPPPVPRIAPAEVSLPSNPGELEQGRK